jgi:hypothetical protein
MSGPVGASLVIDYRDRKMIVDHMVSLLLSGANTPIFPVIDVISRHRGVFSPIFLKYFDSLLCQDALCPQVLGWSANGVPLMMPNTKVNWTFPQ